MKQQYIDDLNTLFEKENFSKDTYSKITAKYDEWYTKLLSDGKTDEEIQIILKSPMDVVSTFVGKFTVNKVNSDDTKITENTTDYTDKNEEIPPSSDVFLNNPTFESDNAVNTNNSTFESDNTVTTNNLISRTTKKGKLLYYKKRSFIGGFIYLILFLISSFFCLPILTSLFSASLALSFAALLVFYLPIYYLSFVFYSGTISYLEPHFFGSSLFHDTINYLNSIIDYMNHFSTFHYDVFLSTLLLSIFALALLILFLFIMFNLVKLFTNYFSFFFRKITLKRVKVKK